MRILLITVILLSVGPAWSMTYNYEHFNWQDAEITNFVLPGEPFPEGSVYDLNGREVPVASLWSGQPAVIEMGSRSCPIFHGHSKAMNKLYRKHALNVRFFVIYTREAHPGPKNPPHSSLEQKAQCARSSQKSNSVNRTMLVDHVEGSLHMRLGSFPNSVYLVGGDGVVAYVSEWNKPKELGIQIQRLLERPAHGLGSQLTPRYFDLCNASAIGPVLMVKTTFFWLERAGWGAIQDVTAAMPTYKRVEALRCPNGPIRETY